VREGDRRLRKFLTAGVVLVVVAGAVIGYLAQLPLYGSPGDGNAAQPNLQTALQGAETYYAAHNHTFLSLMNPEASTLSSIQELDTGLSYVSGSPSTGPHIISTYMGADGSYVVLTVFATATSDCWGVLDLTQPLARTELGISKSPGTYFFVIRKTSPSACNAARLRTVDAFSTTGFPHG